MTNPINLSTAQAKVLGITSGKHAVLAPPGNGKTELLVRRLKKAIDDGIKPEEAVCLTFTNRAARMMAERIGQVPNGLIVGNFHAFAISFLKKVGIFGAQCSVINEDTANDMIDLAVKRLLRNETPDDPETSLDALLSEVEANIDHDLTGYFGMQQTGGPAEKRPTGITQIYLKELIGRIKEAIRPFINLMTAKKYALSSRIVHHAKNSISETLGISSSHLSEKRPLVWSLSIQLGILNLLHNHYASIKSETLAFDFDDLLFETLKWLKHNTTHPLYQSYRWVQVDEAQDLNDLQWEILENIVHPDACLVVFADPQQAIFSFMGANLETLQANIEGLNPVPLGINYRSPKQFLNLYKEYARLNLHYNNELWTTANEETADKKPLEIIETKTDADEREHLATNLIPRLLETDQCKVAILARTNKLAILYSETLYYHGINHFLVSQFDLFCLRVSQDFMAFLQTLERPTCRLPWLRMFAMSDKNMTLDKALHLINKCKEFGLHPHWVLNGTMDDNSYPPKQMIDTAMHGRLVVLDTETTGFDPSTCDIIQFAAVEIVQGKIGRTFEVFLKTDKALGDSVNIHHISKEYLDLNGIEREEGFR